MPEPSGTPKEDAPVSAAGFDFDTTADQARQSCEGAGKTWTSSGQDAFCSGAAKSLGFDAQVKLLFCDGKVCRISIERPPSENWWASLSQLMDVLTKKYGRPSSADAGVPPECQKDPAFMDCLEASKVFLHYEWRWPSQTLALTIGKPKGAQQPKFSLRYSQANAKKKGPINDSAL